MIAARTILALQTIASREVKPGEMAVVTVGYIQAGTKNNIIPDQAELGLTVRTNKPEVRKQVLAAIARITKAEAEAAGAPRPPLVEHYEGTDLVYNDPALAERLKAVLQSALGKDNVVTEEPITASEDFSYFTEQGVPGFYFSLGGADPEKFAQAKAAGTTLPSNHSPLFAPDVDPALHTGIAAEVAVLRNLLSGSAEDLRKGNARPRRRPRGRLHYAICPRIARASAAGSAASVIGPAHHDMACARGNRFGGGNNANLISMAGAGWPDAGSYDGEIFPVRRTAEASRAEVTIPWHPLASASAASERTSSWIVL